MIFDFLYLPWRHQMRVDPVQDRELLGGLGFEKLLDADVAIGQWGDLTG